MLKRSFLPECSFCVLEYKLTICYPIRTESHSEEGGARKRDPRLGAAEKEAVELRPKNHRMRGDQCGESKSDWASTDGGIGDK